MPATSDPPRWEAVERRLRARVARNIRRLRTGRGLSIEAAAGDALSWRQWQRIEAEEHAITLRTLAKLAVALEVEPLELLR